MHKAWYLILVLAALTVVMIVAPLPATSLAALPGPAGAGRHQIGGLADGGDVVVGVDVLVELEAYLDPDFGFELAVPRGWTAVVAAEDDASLALLEPGYAVGFESPQQHVGDVFSDYLMVEIMPGDESGAFDTDERKRRDVTIDGHTGWRDELALQADVSGTPAVDLIVQQASISGVGYTIGLYAIGEPARRAFLDDAFEVMLRTFRLPVAPFNVS